MASIVQLWDLEQNQYVCLNDKKGNIIICPYFIFFTIQIAKRQIFLTAGWAFSLLQLFSFGFQG